MGGGFYFQTASDYYMYDRRCGGIYILGVGLAGRNQEIRYRSQRFLAL